MSFWDSSALVPLIVQQALTDRAERNYQKERGGIIIWWGTLSECVSALARLERSKDLTTDEVEQALKALTAISTSWHEILPSDLLREKANRLMRVHPLRMGDAFQLASAIIASEDLVSAVTVATFDERLTVAARKEGFEIVA